MAFLSQKRYKMNKKAHTVKNHRNNRHEMNKNKKDIPITSKVMGIRYTLFTL
jgi:hypothetical protein